MLVEQILIPTSVAVTGMTVREVFAEATRVHTPGLPFCDSSGHISGRITLKNILKRSCLPDYLVEMALVLGEQLSHVQDLDKQAKTILDQPVDPYVQQPHMSITSASSVFKALAMMEQGDTSYIFVVDQQHYRGVVTIQKLASSLVALDPTS